MLKQIGSKTMRASLPALGDISMSRTATAGITTATAMGSRCSLPCLAPRRFTATTTRSQYTRQLVIFNKLGNNNRRFNFSSSFPSAPSLAVAAAPPSSRRLSSSSSFSTIAAAALPKFRRVSHEVEVYWTQILEGVDKPTAKRLIPYIDPSLPLGIRDPSLPKSSFPSRTASTAAGVLSSIDDDALPSTSTPPATATTTLRGARPPMYQYFLETKLQHPTKIILCRVGEFYETVGIDAILLVQHAGLNPMGKEGNTPRAGCPKGNIRRTVADLVYGAGLSVVICEEVQTGYSYGSKTPRKQRFIGDVVTPASPHYLSGLIDEDSDVILDYAPPLIGIAPQVGGFSVIEIDADLLLVRVTEGLTEDAVYARLHEGGLAPPLYIHIPPAGASADRRLSEAISEAEWERRVSSVFKSQIGAIQKYDDKEPVLGMIERVKRQLNLAPDTQFRHLPAASPKTRPRPLYFSTASNLGLHKTRGVPSLIDYALPAGAPLTVRRWFRKLLLLPPPPTVSLAIHAACAELQNSLGPVPSFPVLIPNNVVLKIRTQQANDTFFRELGDLCRAVAGACSESNTQLESFARNVLIVAGEETGVQLEIENLAKACQEVLEMIHDVVDHDTVMGTGFIRSENEEESTTSDSEGDDKENNENDIASSSSSLLLAAAGLLPLELSPFARMFSATEDFRGKIRPEKLKDALLVVENARQQIIAEASNALSLATASTSTTSASPTSSSTTASVKSGPATKLTKPVFVYDVANNAAWVRIPRGSATTKAAFGLVHPRDRNGKTETGFYSTSELEQAQDAYRRACADARDAVRTELKKLAESLQPKLTQLVAATTFAVVASALDAHVREAARRGWALPQLTFSKDVLKNNGTVGEGEGDFTATRTINANTSSNIFKIDGMWPYWLGGTAGLDQGKIKNSFLMDGMFLLTGPNMAGKSTLLRSTCAVALLGACGLAVPASSSSAVPYFDAFMLRNFSADSPLEELSSFAVEMKEMRYVLTDTTSQSLVLVDELGKGTEARAGAGIAGGILEALDSSGCKGVFATHLHSLLDLPLRIPGTRKMMMEIEEIEKESQTSKSGGGRYAYANGGREESTRRVERKPTWRMVPGESVESLALEVAASQGLPDTVLDRAADLYAQILNKCVGVGVGGGENGNENGNSSHSNTTSFAKTNTSSSSSGISSSPPSPPSPAYGLTQAAVLLEGTATAVLQALKANNNPSSPSHVVEPSPNIQPSNGTIQAHLIPVGMIPPVRTVGASCVYIVRRSDGWYYVGSSDSLQDRIKTHRQRGSNSRIADPKAEFAYVVVSHGERGRDGEEKCIGGNGAAGASAAKSVEAEVIRAMKTAGYPLLSEADARKRYAPVSQRNFNGRNARYS
ncbi:hypothetical protein Ndes2526B_g00720 [Nannochloris sp. 'desiccata']